MPYMLVGNAVHKQNADGSAGEVVPGGSHATHEEALAHLRALEANVEDAKTVTKTPPIKWIGEPATDYFHGDYLKAMGNGKVGGYLIVFGGPRDAQNEFFYPHVELHLDWFDGNKRPVLYHHGLNDEDLIEEIGYVTSIVKDDHGWWCEAQLDMDNPTAQRVYSDAQKGRIGWSSGSSPHLSKVDDQGGIYEWTFIEASLTPTPAAGKRTTVQALKFDTSTFSPDANADIEPGTAKGPTQARGHKGVRKQANTKGKDPMKTDVTLIAAMQKAGIPPEQILEVLMAAPEEIAEEDPETEMMAAPPPSEPPEAESMEPSQPAKDKGPVTYGDAVTISDGGPEAPTGASSRVKPGDGAGKTKADTTDIGKIVAAEVARRFSQMKTAPAARQPEGFTGENPARKTSITNMQTPYHNLSAGDMAFLYQMRLAGKTPRQMPIAYQREMIDKAIKAAQNHELDLDVETYRKLAVKSAEGQSVGVANDGQNWVPDLWSSALWQRVRIDNNVAKNIEVFQMPSPTFEYPIESTDPTVYSVGEAESDTEMTFATNVFTRSKITTSKLQFAAKKLGLQVLFSSEINEDSIIPFIPQLRAQATRSFANAVDNVILNSDATTGTGNINYKGADTSAASTSRWLFGGGNGMRYNALVANTSVQVNFGGGVPTLTGLRTLRFKLISATNAYGVDPEQIMYIVDPYTYGKLLSIDEINVFMNNGKDATVNTGVVKYLDGSPVYPSQELALADSTGYALAAGTGTLGSIVVAARNAWKVGYMRQVMTDVSYVPWNDTYVLTMTARFAIGKKDTVAAGLGFNILVS